MSKAKALSATAYVTSIILGNIFVIVFGIGVLTLSNATGELFSLTFPMGALWIGMTFSCRDFVQRYWGHSKAWLWMGIASVVTFLFNRDIAVASMVAFVASETIDWICFYLLRNRSLRTRLIVSNIFSCPVDSVLFVSLAFGWYWPAVWGQTIIKYLFSFTALPLAAKVDKLVLKQEGENNGI